MENQGKNQSFENSNDPITANDLKGAWNNINQFMVELLDFRKDTDKKGTIEDVKNNISMKGHTAWVLVFSILIASIGLQLEKIKVTSSD